ncbi:uncharacterized protein IWZ02DRAFT_402520, partial [Phyllosticta citriasiana]|uniref:uncharacterized protein n=1 Tax=Phyllosticta citriasiana TaxID=595635 RepID=UPI0030FDE714
DLLRRARRKQRSHFITASCINVTSWLLDRPNETRSCNICRSFAPWLRFDRTIDRRATQCENPSSPRDLFGLCPRRWTFGVALLSCLLVLSSALGDSSLLRRPHALVQTAVNGDSTPSAFLHEVPQCHALLPSPLTHPRGDTDRQSAPCPRALCIPSQANSLVISLLY